MFTFGRTGRFWAGSCADLDPASWQPFCDTASPNDGELSRGSGGPRGLSPRPVPEVAPPRETGSDSSPRRPSRSFAKKVTVKKKKKKKHPGTEISAAWTAWQWSGRPAAEAATLVCVDAAHAPRSVCPAWPTAPAACDLLCLSPGSPPLPGTSAGHEWMQVSTPSMSCFAFSWPASLLLPVCPHKAFGPTRPVWLARLSPHAQSHL